MAFRITMSGGIEPKTGAKFSRLSISELNAVTMTEKSWHYVIIPRKGGFSQILSHMDTDANPMSPDSELVEIPNEAIPARHVRLVDHLWAYAHSDWSDE